MMPTLTPKTHSTLLALALLAAAGAARAAPATASAPQPGAPTGPSRDAQPQHWSDALRASVRQQCESAGPSPSFCACLARELELRSPDPDTAFTTEEMDTSLASCQQERAQQAGQLL
jgi:hypothetical protein